MDNNRRLFWAGSYAATLYWFLSELFTPILSLHVSDLGFSAFQLAIIFAAQTFVPFLFTIQIGSIADKIGQQNVLAIGSGLMFLGSSLLLLSNHFLVLIVIQTLVGVGHIAVWLSSQTIVTYVGGGYREKAISRMSFFTAIGQLLGPLFGGLISDQFNYSWAFASYAVLSLGLLAVYIIMPKKQRDEKESNNDSKGAKENKKVSFLGSYKEGAQLYASNRGIQVSTFISFSLAFILFMRVSYLPIYLKEQSYSVSEISFYVALWSLASILIRPFTARLIESFGRYMVTGIALYSSIAGVVGIFLFQESSIGLAAAVIIVGLGTGLNQPLAISLVSSSTTRQNRGLGMGLRLMSNRLANWICPIAIGTTTHFVTLGASFAVVSVPLLAVSVVSMKLLRKLVEQN